MQSYGRINVHKNNCCRVLRAGQEPRCFSSLNTNPDNVQFKTLSRSYKIASFLNDFRIHYQYLNKRYTIGNSARNLKTTSYEDSSHKSLLLVNGLQLKWYVRTWFCCQ
jgi:hypothetical protein